MSLTPSLPQVATFWVLCTALYYLVARAELTRPLWSRYRGVLDAVARCPACSGSWIGATLGLLLAPRFDLSTLVLSVVLGVAWGLVLTPLGTWGLMAALAATTIGEEAAERADDEPR